jgi:spore coat protein U-like protein
MSVAGSWTARLAVAALLVAATMPAARAAGTCTVAATALVFTAFNPLQTAADYSPATITMTCTKGAGNGTYYVALSAGGSGNYQARQMKGSAGGALSYQLYLDSGHTTVWPPTNCGTAACSGPASVSISGGTTKWTVYGAIPAPQNKVIPGTYTDTITVTLTY